MNGCMRVSVLLLDVKEKNRAMANDWIDVNHWEKQQTVVVEIPPFTLVIA
jgi:hypothetical protein